MKKILCLSIIGFIYFQSSLQAQHGPKYDSLKLALAEVQDDSIKSEISFAISLTLIENDFKNSLRYAIEALEYASHAKAYKLKNRIAVTSGSVALSKGLFDQAVYFYGIQLQLGQELNKQDIIGKAYYNLGTVRLILEDYTLAKEYFEKALSNLDEYNLVNQSKLSALEEVTIDNALGVAYTGLEEYEKAADIFLKGIEVSKDNTGLRFNYSQISNNYADLLLKQGRFEEAKTILKGTILIEEEDSNDMGLIVSLLYLGKAEIQSGHYLLAKNYLQRGLSIASQITGFSDKKHLSAALSEVYDKLNYPDSSLHFLTMSLAYEDSMAIQKARDELLKRELQQEYAGITEALDQENRSMKKKNFFALLFSFLLIGLLIAFYFIWEHRLKKTKSKHLDLLKDHEVVVDINQQLSSEIELKNQEIILSEIKTAKSSDLLENLANKVKLNAPDSTNAYEIKKLVNELKASLGSKDFPEFEVRFRQVHGSFYEKLVTTYPNLTMNERRLAAFLKLQLTTKEISGITGQSVRAVELARTRLRKKLGLTNSDQNLYDFFLMFDSKNRDQSA